MNSKIKIACVGIAALGLGWWMGSAFSADGRDGENTAIEDALSNGVWTCSMHPQIRQTKAGKCPICAMDLVAVEASAGSELGPRELALSPAAQKLAQVQTAVVERRFVEVETRMVGKVAIDETRLRDISAWVPGRIDRLYVDYTGVQVNEGDHMVYLYSPELLTAQQELVQALRALEQLGDGAVPSLRQTDASTVESARQRLRLWGLTPAQVAHIESVRTPSDRLTIYAPSSGVVVERHVGQGAYVKTGERIYTIADLSSVWLTLEAYESDLPWIHYGQEVDVVADSHPGERFGGRIAFINPLLDEATRTVAVRVNVPNGDGRLKPGMLVRAVARARTAADGRVIDASLAGKWISPMHPEIVKDEPGACDVCGMALVRSETLGYAGREVADVQAPLVLPVSAPLITGKRAVVYVAVPGKAGHFEGREIELGPRAGDYYIVQSGLREGEQVVVNGAFKIDSALQIQAKPSMMNPAGQETTIGDDRQQDSLVHPRIFEAYLVVQQGLSADRLSAAQVGAGQVRSDLHHMAEAALPGTDWAQWGRVSAEIDSAAAILLNAADIGAARAAFLTLSNALLALADGAGSESMYDLGVYHCPMAFEGAGASWIQRIEDVANPYFGAAMLRCGSQQRRLADGRE